MTKNPFLNALTAGLYIVTIGLVMGIGTKYAPKDPTLIAPIAAIFLFTLSAAVMGYLFCYQPIQLYFDGMKKLAVELFSPNSRGLWRTHCRCPWPSILRHT